MAGHFGTYLAWLVPLLMICSICCLIVMGRRIRRDVLSTIDGEDERVWHMVFPRMFVPRYYWGAGRFAARINAISTGLLLLVFLLLQFSR